MSVLPPLSVTVKSLEWLDTRGDGTLTARTSVGLIYVASPQAWGFRNYPDANPVEGGIEVAKAGAQMDFDTRIQSSLSEQIMGSDEIIEIAEKCALFSTPSEYAGLADHAAFEAGQDNAIKTVTKLLRDTLSATPVDQGIPQ